MSLVVEAVVENVALPTINLHCIAPRLSSQKLGAYRDVLQEAFPQDSPDAMAVSDLLDVAELAMSGKISPLMPTPEQRADLGQRFDVLKEPQRTAAYHLLWCANEIALGRTPLFE